MKKREDFWCSTCNRPFGEKQIEMIRKINILHSLCDEDLQGEKYVVYEITIPEESFAKGYEKPRFARQSVSNLRHELVEIRKNLCNVYELPVVAKSSDMIWYFLHDYLLNDVDIPFRTIEQYDVWQREIWLERKAILSDLYDKAEEEEEKAAKKAAKKAEEEAKKAAAKEKSKSAFNPPEYPPAQKIKCKGSAQMISNAPAQRAWLEKWAKDAWNEKDLWSAKTAKQYVADKKNGVGTIFARPVVVQAVAFDGVEAEPIED
jgi:hypothetical protein